MKITTTVLLLLLTTFIVFGQTEENTLMKENLEAYDQVTGKMDIIPGIWRPMFESEQVVWISPSWESEEYVWLDFPECIWINGKMVYLGHIDQRFPTKYPLEKSAEWHTIDNGIKYEQVLPNGLSFGGEVTKVEPNIASLKLWINNGTPDEVKEVKLLTCTYLNGIKEFSELTDDNKYIHIPEKGWIQYLDTVQLNHVEDGIRVGWLSGKQISDLPVIVVKSKIEGHLLAVSWYNNTYSFVGNPKHPCVHADPYFNDLKPGEQQTIEGELIFFEGTLIEFEKMFRERMNKK